MISGLTATLVLTACSGADLPGRPDTEGAATAADQLATALSKEDLSGLTFADGATGAADEFDTLTEPLGGADLEAAVEGEPTVDGDTATAKINFSWQLPSAKQPWTYTVTATFSKPAQDWQPQWQPSLVHPELRQGATLRMVREQADRGTIIGADQNVLVKNRPVARIGIDKTRLDGSDAAESAADLANLLDIDSADYVKQVKGAGDQAFVEAIVFRENDPNRPDDSDLDAIDGAVALDDAAMLAPSRTFAAPILGTVGAATKEIVEDSDGAVEGGDQVGLSGLQSRYDKRLRGQPSVTVELVPPDDASASPSPESPESSPSAEESPSADQPQVVYQSKAKAGKELTITLDEDLQNSAEEILADTDPASALVAIKPSTGAIVAAANGPGTDGANIATFGQYPPGSVFKIIDALALIRNGVKPSDSMECSKTVTVDGREFENYDDYPSSALGSVDFRTAFANSCNTAFIDAREQVDGEDLNEAAASLGLGTDYDIGFPAYFGSIPKPESETERAATMIGQGRVQVSPMAMATVVASVQAGKTVLPHLVDGKTADPDAKKLTAQEAAQLQELMRAVVTDGSGSVLQSAEPPEVIAKTGTAEYGTDTPPDTHAWMVAGQDDLAVAVFVADGDSGSGIAGPLLRRFLQNA